MSHATAFADPTTSPTDVDDVAFHLEVFLSRYRGETAGVYATRMNVLFAWCATRGLHPIHDVTRRHLELYSRYLEDDRGNSRTTVHGSLCTIKMFYRLLAIDGLIPFSPAEYVRMPKVQLDDVKVLGLQRPELMRMIYTARQMSPDHSALVTLMAYLGLRVSEACQVQVDDFAGEVRGHRVLRLVRKGGKPQTIPLPPVVCRELERCADGRDGQLLYRLDGVTPLDRRAAYRMVKAIARRAGVTDRVTPHVFRHSYVTNGLDAGVSLRDMQIGAGHADPRTTARYDNARRSLDGHANHILGAWLAGSGD